MADVVKIVDSIAANPTVRLDLNGEASNGWYTRLFKAPPPRLRRASAQNAMRDGVHVSSSQHDARVLTLELELIKTGAGAQDAHATELQKLARELDRPDNFLMYQPNGLTKPVFFRLFRSDFTDLEDVIAQSAMRRFTVELLAEPFALGLLETVTLSVSNDPDSATPFRFQTPSSILGDVRAPFFLFNTTGFRKSGVMIGPGVITATQAEAMTLGTDTTNPGGGPDAAMSGTGTNNFRRCSFGTNAAEVTRLSLSMTGIARRYFAIVRRSDSTSVMTASIQVGSTAGASVTVPANTTRQVIDLGTVGMRRAQEFPRIWDTTNKTVALRVGRTSGTGTIDIDALVAVQEYPDGQTRTLMWSASGTDDTSVGMVFNGHDEVVESVTGGSPETFYPEGMIAVTVGDAVDASGGFPSVMGGVPMVLFLMTWDSAGTSKSLNDSYTLRYFPRYIYVRPSAS